MTATGVGSREVGFVQRIGVKTHLTSRLVQVVPEGERQVEVVTEMNQAVEGGSQLVVLQELERR